MNRALVRDLEEPRPLLLGQRAMELDVALDGIQHPVLLLTVLARRASRRALPNASQT